MMAMKHLSNAFSLLKVDVADEEGISTIAEINKSEKKNEKGWTLELIFGWLQVFCMFGV